jgi:GntR family transcriptional regulator
MHRGVLNDNSAMQTQRLLDDGTPTEGMKSLPLGNFQESGVAKYLQLRNALARQISAGKWKPGSRLPPEEKLVSMSGLSLGTVQRALRLLVDDGLLIRKQGLGTFVASDSAPMNAPFHHCRFLDDEGGLLTIYSKVLARGKADSGGQWSAHLDGDGIECIDRLFSIEKEFSIYVRLYFDPERLPFLSTLRLEELNGINLKVLLTRELHFPVTRFAENLSVRFFPDFICKALTVPRRTSGGVMEIVAYDTAGQVLYFQELYIPPNPRRLLISP